MKQHIHFFIFMLCSLILVNVHATTSKKSSAHSLDSIAAIVNDPVITQSELNKQLANVKRQFTEKNTLPANVALRKQVLDQLINRKLQLDLADRAGIKASPEVIQKAIKQIASANKVTVTQLYEQASKQGLNKQDYQKEIHDEIVMQQLQQQQVGSKITISEQEVNDFLRSAAWRSYNSKEYHLQDILIALPEVPSQQDVADAKQHADNVLTKLHQGVTFEQAAISESASTQALQGGDLGWRKLPEIPPAFSEQLVHMRPGEIMGPVFTSNGFHIVKLVAIRNKSQTVVAQTQHKQVEQLIFQRKFEEALQGWLTKLRGEAFIHTSSLEV